MVLGEGTNNAMQACQIEKDEQFRKKTTRTGKRIFSDLATSKHDKKAVLPLPTEVDTLWWISTLDTRGWSFMV